MRNYEADHKKDFKNSLEIHCKLEMNVEVWCRSTSKFQMNQKRKSEMDKQTPYTKLDQKRVRDKRSLQY